METIESANLLVWNSHSIFWFDNDYFYFQYVGTPVAYVQQVLIKATVAPWDDKKLIHVDAFRAPLHKAFEVLEHIQNFQYKEGSV